MSPSQNFDAFELFFPYSAALEHFFLSSCVLCSIPPSLPCHVVRTAPNGNNLCALTLGDSPLISQLCVQHGTTFGAFHLLEDLALCSVLDNRVLVKTLWVDFSGGILVCVFLLSQFPELGMPCSMSLPAGPGPPRGRLR